MACKLTFFRAYAITKAGKMEWKSCKEEKIILSFYPILATRSVTTSDHFYLFREWKWTFHKWFIVVVVGVIFINFQLASIFFLSSFVVARLHNTHILMRTLEVMHISSKKFLLCNQQNNTILTFLLLVVYHCRLAFCTLT